MCLVTMGNMKVWTHLYCPIAALLIRSTTARTLMWCALLAADKTPVKWRDTYGPSVVFLNLHLRNTVYSKLFIQSELAFLYHINYTIQPVSDEQAQTVSVCVLQCVWPHQLQVRLGTGQSGLQAVFSPSVYWVWLWPMAAYRPAGNVDTPHTCTYLLIPGKKKSPFSLYPQGEKCIMGQERSFRKRKETAFCIKGKSYTSALTTKPCQCTEKDFTWWDLKNYRKPWHTENFTGSEGKLDNCS